EDALAELGAARAAVEAAEARVAAGAEAARIEQIRYDTGAGTVEDLLRARAREEGAHSDLARAHAHALTAGARINSIVERKAVQ
ncbi:MAG: TolC family protein, partial [Deltaproteobacteria bacterium]|nr:TolC family protein [Deltaproteobacteria bacterium]